jgi:hypothetical protein
MAQNHLNAPFFQISKELTSPAPFQCDKAQFLNETRQWLMAAFMDEKEGPIQQKPQAMQAQIDE